MPFKYDLAISFAGEDRELAEWFATSLDATGYSIFYDSFFQAELWGRDLSIALKDIYAKDARFCLILLSQHYLDKPWAVFERQNAISRFIFEKTNNVLCLKIDELNLPGLPTVTGYISINKFPKEKIYEFLLQKLGLPDHEFRLSKLKSEDINIARAIIKACYRRAIYTKMDSEIDMKAMEDSIGKAIGELQRLIPQIEQPHLQLICVRIISSLDEIQRNCHTSGTQYSHQVSADKRRIIDTKKIEVLKLVLEIRRAANIPMQLPFTLQINHFFSLEQAELKPEIID